MNRKTLYEQALGLRTTHIIYLGGGLELGVIRDSSIDTTQDWQVFAEVFEGVAKLANVDMPTTITITSA